MARRTKDLHLYEFAKRGAEFRFRELLLEAKLLLELFPHLGDSLDKEGLPLTFIMARASGALTAKAGRRRTKK